MESVLEVTFEEGAEGSSMDGGEVGGGDVEDEDEDGDEDVGKRDGGDDDDGGDVSKTGVSSEGLVDEEVGCWVAGSSSRMTLKNWKVGWDGRLGCCGFEVEVKGWIEKWIGRGMLRGFGAWMGL